MSRLINLIFILILSALVAGCAAGSKPAMKAVEAQVDGNYLLAKQIRYSFTLSNTSNKFIEKAEFWTYAPVPKTSHQKVMNITSNMKFKQTADELGNNILNFEVDNIPPFGAKIISVTADLMMSVRPIPSVLADSARFKSPEPFVESNDERIVQLASRLRDVNLNHTVRNDYDWVVKNIKSETYVAEDRGAAYAYESRKGDCTEFSYLLTALFRAQQIPARPMGGYVFDSNGVVKAMDYHNWTEFYLNGAWQIADAQKGALMDKQTDYVAMREITTGGKLPIGSQRFSYAGEGLQVTMN
jgi:transglutaminase-like putative cysteine protease